MDPVTAAYFDLVIKSGVAGLAIAALVYLVQWIIRQLLANFDKHITALVASINSLGDRVNALERDVGEIKVAVLRPHGLRVFCPDDTDPAA